MTMDDSCLFCSIVDGDIPASIVHRDDDVVAFEDINPGAPTHVLVIPTHHYVNIADLAKNEPDTVARLALVGQDVADQRGLAGHRFVFNTGAAAGQSVFHVHGHVIGGRNLSWPPG